MSRTQRATKSRTHRAAPLAITLVLVLTLLLVAAAAATPAQAAPPPSAAAQWTVAIYCAGDNDLEKYWAQYSLPGLLEVPSSPGLNIVAAIDRLSASGTELVEIEGGAQRVVATYPELDFGDGATFAWFLGAVRQLYPSTHLAVVMWDHGFGWRYIAKDETSGGDRISMDELRQAIVDAGSSIDILAFDACNMADVAVAYEVALTGRVGIMVASEESVPANGFPYDKMLTHVAQDPSRDAKKVAADMVAGWKAYYDGLTWANSAHLSAVDIGRIAAAAPDLRSWAARLGAGLPAARKGYDAALKLSWTPWATRYEDLSDACARLAASKAVTDPTLKALSTKVRADLAGALIAQDTAPKSATAGGLSIWWATQNTWTAFQGDFQTQVSFAQPSPTGVGWWAFLDAYNGR